MTTEKPKYLFTITTFDADPDRVATPLVLANSALACGADVLLWLSLDENRVLKSEWIGAAAVLAAGQGRQAFSF